MLICAKIPWSLLGIQGKLSAASINHQNLGGFMAAFPTFGPGIASLSKGGTEKSEKHWNVEAVRRSPNFFQCLDMAKCCKSATLVVNVQPRLGKIY